MATKNTIDDLRDHLFMAIESLQDASSADEIDLAVRRSDGIARAARQIIDSAKAEVSLAAITGGTPGSRLWAGKKQLRLVNGRGQA